MASVTGPWIFTASGSCLHSAKWWLVFVPVEGTVEFSEGHKPWDSYSPFKQNRDFMI